MTELTKILITASSTLIGGVTIFTTGRIIEKFYIEPIHNFRSTVGEIAFSLIYYANIYSNASIGDPKIANEALDTLRKLASDLSSKSNSIPCYYLFSLLRIVPRLSDSKTACSNLIGLSNSYTGIDPKEIHERRTIVQKALKIKPL